jgi:hypothetical protein
LSVIILFGLGLGFLIAFIKDKGGNNYIDAALIILGVISMIYIVRDEIKSKKELTRNKTQYLELGKLLFKKYTTDFEVIYNAYLHAENKNLKPIEVLQDFADNKGISLTIDWKGEENEGEIQDFISSHINKKISWTNTNKLKENKTVISEDKFIIRLFKTIDEDLKEINNRLLFFDLVTDSYIFTVTDTTTFKAITKIDNKYFHGSEKL